MSRYAYNVYLHSWWFWSTGKNFLSHLSGKFIFIITYFPHTLQYVIAFSKYTTIDCYQCYAYQEFLQWSSPSTNLNQQCSANDLMSPFSVWGNEDNKVCHIRQNLFQWQMTECKFPKFKQVVFWLKCEISEEKLVKLAPKRRFETKNV